MSTNGHPPTLRPEKGEPTIAPTARIDRRVARTRVQLHQAHMALMREHGYEAVTVEAICARADVARSTFYAHFAGKAELHASGLAHLRQALMAHVAGPTDEPAAPADPLGFCRPMFEHAGQNLDLFRALTRERGGPEVLDDIRRLIADVVRAGLAPRADEAAAAREVRAQFVAGAFMAVLTGWLEAGAEAPADEMAARFRRLVAEGAA